jgi:hypothetical protein
MRTVLKSSDEVFHYWANKVQSEGRAGNVFFRDSRIFSYGAHFVIARHLPSDTVAFTERYYSPSTARHVSKARSAASHLRAVFCHDPAGDARANMAQARREICDALCASEKPRLRQATRDGHKARALRIAERANAYLEALPTDERAGQDPIDTSALESVRDALVANDAAIERIRAEQRIARQRQTDDDLTMWRARAVIASTRLREIPPALRLSEDGSIVQTSHGAEIPASDALHLWKLMSKGMRDVNLNFPLGVYRLTRINADGSIVVGCHTIAYSEIDRIADALSLEEV